MNKSTIPPSPLVPDDAVQIVPFSNGSEFMMWQADNCDKCIHYECESQKPEDAKCKLAFYLDFGTISGEMPLVIAEAIGYKDKHLTDCQHLDDGTGINDGLNFNLDFNYD